MNKTRRYYALYLAASLMVLALIVSVVVDDGTLAGHALWVIILLAAATVALHLFALSFPESVETSTAVTLPKKDAVILIIGPYASKWFGQSGTTKQVRYSDSVTWILIRTPEALEEKLEYFQQQSPETQLCALFPFLPDGHDTTSLMLDQLAVWQRHSANSARLPCTFALYSRLSDNAITANKANWSGEMDLLRTKQISFHNALSSLESSLASHPGETETQIQRTIFGHQLIAWLKESQLADRLDELFSHSRLTLNRILLCDYNRGFTRHGAWSRWSEEQFAVLPALGATAAALPCAPLKNTHPGEKQASGVAFLTRRNHPKMLWSVILATLVLGLHMLHTTRWLDQQQQAYRDEAPAFASGLQLSLARLNQNITKLQHSRAQFTQCAHYRAMGFWGFPVCNEQLQLIDDTLFRLHALPTLTTAGQSVLFTSGSAAISRKAWPALEQIKALANRFPERSFLIVGHTDNSGNEGMNSYLSRQRAVAVRDWLVSQNTLAPERLVTHGVGATEPVASNQTSSGREQNRRIEVLVLPSSQPSETFE